MRKMWKRALAGVLTASMALSLAACGGSSSNGGSSADGSTTLEVWSSNLSDSQRENVKKLVAQYEEQTGVKVNYTEFSYDMLHDKILSAAAGGNTPDVAWVCPSGPANSTAWAFWRTCPTATQTGTTLPY